MWCALRGWVWRWAAWPWGYAVIFLILVVLLAIYITVGLLVAVPAWTRAFATGGPYRSAWVRTLLVGLPIILVGINRALVWHADREVDRLCALDGGVHVYQTVTLGPENFGPDGSVFPQYERLMAERNDITLRYGPEYLETGTEETLRTGSGVFAPGLTRSVGRFVRVRDGKLLGQWISYSRFGGDLPGPWAASSHSCKSSMFQPPIDRVLFIKSGSQQ